MAAIIWGIILVLTAGERLDTAVLGDVVGPSISADVRPLSLEAAPAGDFDLPPLGRIRLEPPRRPPALLPMIPWACGDRLDPTGLPLVLRHEVAARPRVAANARLQV